MKRFICLAVLVALVLAGCMLPNKKRTLTPAEEKALAGELYDESVWFERYIAESEAKVRVAIPERNTDSVHREYLKVADLLPTWRNLSKPATGELELAAVNYYFSLSERFLEFIALHDQVKAMEEGDLRSLRTAEEIKAKAKKYQEDAMETSSKAQEQLKKLANR